MDKDNKINNIFDSERRKMANEYNKIKEKRKWIKRLVYLVFWFVFFIFSLEYYLYIFTSWLNWWELRLIFYLIMFILLFFVFQCIFDYHFFYKLDRNYELVN